MAKRHVSITVFGNVQGVYFRARSAEKACELGLDGFVCNQPDGTVYLEAEGEEKMLREFIAWCLKGPSRAEVKKVEDVWDDKLTGFTKFEIRYK